MENMDKMYVVICNTDVKAVVMMKRARKSGGESRGCGLSHQVPLRLRGPHRTRALALLPVLPTLYR